jgi:hypothetical protein
MLDEGDTKNENRKSHMIGLLNYNNAMLGKCCVRPQFKFASKIEFLITLLKIFL